MSENIVLISIDSLRADRCGHLGGRHLTPTLDSLADDGISFQQAHAPGPKTPESMPAVFTGQQWWSPNAEFDMNAWGDSIRPHMSRRESIAEALSRAGYETIAFTPNGFTSQYFGFDSGFDHFEDFLDDEIRPGFDIPNFVRGLIKFVRKEGNWKTWERYYDDVLDSVESASEPYFLWVFLLDVHSPYLVPREYRSENSFLDMMRANWKRDDASESDGSRDKLVSAYDDTVGYADEFISQLTADLADSDPTYVIHSDHGEAFWEHGRQGHDRLLYQENLHVPFVVGNTDVETTVERPISLKILPDLLGAIAADDLQSLVEDLEREDWTTPVVAHSEEGARTAVRLGPYKYIANHDGDAELYDLSTDPHERTDLSDDRTELLSLLRSCEQKYRQTKIEEASIRDSAAEVAETARL